MEIKDSDILYITGAGVSAESGIPTFRGEDGYWTIGSKNYTPHEMATRDMYEHKPDEFLTWYYQRFVNYRDIGPNQIHYWLADKNLITQNIDGLDGRAGNKNYIPIHGNLEQMTLFHNQGDDVPYIKAPWDEVDPDRPQESLLQLFNIDPDSRQPKINQSYKPYILLFDEFYTELYRISEAKQRMLDAKKMVFMGTSCSVNITQMALQIAFDKELPVEIVDPDPVQLAYDNVTYYKMPASEYIKL